MNALVLMVAMMAAPNDTHVERTVTVTGDAEVRVVPDTAQLWLAVETVDKSIVKAKAANDERVKKTLETLKKLGLADKDVATDYLTVEARYDSGSYSRSASTEPDGYAVKKSVVVTLRDLKHFEETIQAVLGAGTNRIEGQEFRTSELRKHRDAARAMALKAAHEKAVAMAAELGAKAGKVRSINEYGGGYSYGWRGRFGGGMAQNVSQNIGGGGDEAASEQGFAPGLISVRTQVQVVFDLE